MFDSAGNPMRTLIPNMAKLPIHESRPNFKADLSKSGKNLDIPTSVVEDGNFLLAKGGSHANKQDEEFLSMSPGFNEGNQIVKGVVFNGKMGTLEQESQINENMTLAYYKSLKRS